MMSISTSTVIWYLKILLISTGAVSVSMAMKVCVPIVVHNLVMVWTGFAAFLRPLYLYIAINVIILVIAFVSRFQQESFDELQLRPGEYRPLVAEIARNTSTGMDSVKFPPVPNLNRVVTVAGPELKPAFDKELVAVALEDEPEPEMVEVKPVVVNGAVVAVNEYDDYDAGAAAEAEDFSDLAIVPAPIEAEIGLVLWPAAEKTGLRLARPKQHETLENTWRMIMEKSHAPPTRQLRRSDTFKNAAAAENKNNHAPPRPRNRDALKSRTFKDRTNYDSPAAAPAPATNGSFRKVLSPSQDELNRRVEAFIKKFNEEMRLQRQQSIQQHMEMINRGTN